MSLVFFLGEGGIAYLQCTESGIQSALNMRGHPCRWAQVGPKDPQPFGFPALTDLQAAAERACGPGPAQTPGWGTGWVGERTGFSIPGGDVDINSIYAGPAPQHNTTHSTGHDR